MAGELKADEKAEHENKEAQLKAIRLCSQLSKNEENMSESKRKFEKAKQKMMMAEAMANGSRHGGPGFYDNWNWGPTGGPAPAGD